MRFKTGRVPFAPTCSLACLYEYTSRRPILRASTSFTFSLIGRPRVVAELPGVAGGPKADVFRHMMDKYRLHYVNGT